MLQAALGPGYRLIQAEIVAHTTPAGTTQDFIWSLFRKNAG